MSAPLRLSEFHATARPHAARVAVRAGHTIVWSAFARDIEALAGTLIEHGQGRWLLFSEDAYAFAVGLLALWQAGSTAIVPPNLQEGTLAELGAGARGMLTDVDPGVSTVGVVLHPGRVRSRANWTWTRLDERAPRLELFTSGTTGARKPIPKALSHLDEEIEGLERQWGATLEGRQAFATVSHHHIYGLLFRLLWPLCAGRPFWAEAYLHADELVSRMDQGEPSWLVSAPVHLRHLVTSSDFCKLGDACRPIFSSGGPLDELTADRLTRAFGESALEVFGSTETGGVAWRQQRPGPHRLAWTPFANVVVDRSSGGEMLAVTSPFVSTTRTPPPFVMEDRVQFRADGRFLLLGRADRTVKVGEKRISLPELEERFRTHRHVDDIGLVRLDHAPEPRVAAVVVLSELGRTALALEGRRAMAAALTRHVRQDCDPVALPRSWRYVDTLPRDSQGKVPEGALRELFADPSKIGIVSPEILDETREDGSCERIFRVPAGLVHLKGHFPDFPIVPGVVQIAWVVDAARALVQGDVDLLSLEALKFKELLRPGQVLRLRVELSTSRDMLHFRLWDGVVIFALGRGRIRPPGRGQSDPLHADSHLQP